MKVGDLVKYRENPHESLQHLVGIVTGLIRGRYHDRYDQTGGVLNMVWVMWGHDRPQGLSGALLEEWIDELEVINESR